MTSSAPATSFRGLPPAVWLRAHPLVADALLALALLALVVGVRHDEGHVPDEITRMAVVLGARCSWSAVATR